MYQPYDFSLVLKNPLLHEIFLVESSKSQSVWFDLFTSTATSLSPTICDYSFENMRLTKDSAVIKEFFIPNFPTLPKRPAGTTVRPFVVAETEPIYGVSYFTTEGSTHTAYLVLDGRRMGVFNSWAACIAQVHKYPKARYIPYDLREEAQADWGQVLQNGTWGDLTSTGDRICLRSLPPFGMHIVSPLTVSAYVQAGVEKLDIPFECIALLPPDNIEDLEKKLAEVMLDDFEADRLKFKAQSQTKSLRHPISKPKAITSSLPRMDLDPIMEVEPSKAPCPMPTDMRASKIKIIGNPISDLGIALTFFTDARNTRGYHWQFSETSPDTHKILDSFWYVVTHGAYPGIYSGRFEAETGLGNAPVKKLHAFLTLKDAGHFLNWAFMSDWLVEYNEQGVSRCIGCGIKHKF
ncbi:hypothetical protein NP233_g486 [Leucocoprinus birnbaumii]|uniref:Ribonuclease H1 N-terminal domain-containing protein n=1 Tax=Leucocoprinus birnbaumii TaxID=56174 RepID=A0AAD5YVR9_9AGAR|nr:hypothetical protein NP233_g486 [Leucocoprinus birnbaumii]